MAGFMPDTSCLLAAVCGWHEYHAAAADEMNRRVARREPMFLAAPALVETYAVLTRLPPPHRLAPRDALALVEATYQNARRVVALDGRGYRTLLRHLGADGVAGGRTYDAVIAACARKARANTLLTFNVNDFEAIAGTDLEIIEPGA
jgi:predicted nucleic acid-binding protein